jgi:hypothetical protein
MQDDDEPAGAETRKPVIKDAPALPGQLGQKLRSMFDDVAAQPIPERLAELLEALAAKEKEPE